MELIIIAPRLSMGQVINELNANVPPTPIRCLCLDWRNTEGTLLTQEKGDPGAKRKQKHLICLKRRINHLEKPIIV